MTVQYSIQRMVSDGTLSTIALGIQYLQRNDIYVRIAGVDTPQSGAPSGYTWSFIDSTTLKILPVVPNGIEVVVYRRTDVNAMYNVYSQNAQFDEATIDENNRQLLYIAQEYLEQKLQGVGVDTLEYVRDDGSFTYYRMRRTDGSYSEEFTVPSASSSTKVLTRESLRRSYAEADYNLVGGSFEAGGKLVNANDVLLQEYTGKAFSGPAGVVAAGTDPASGRFVDVSNKLGVKSAVTLHEGKASAHPISGVTGLRAELDALAVASGGITATNDRLVVVEGKVATLEQRKSTCLVNAVGTGAHHETVVAQLPTNVAVNSRYVLPNPFGINVPVECWAEIFANNRWARAGFMFGVNGTSSGGYGTAASYVQGEGVVVQTGTHAVLITSSASGSGHNIAAVITSAPCRVFVCKLEA